MWPEVFFVSSPLYHSQKWCHCIANACQLSSSKRTAWNTVEEPGWITKEVGGFQLTVIGSKHACTGTFFFSVSLHCAFGAGTAVKSHVASFWKEAACVCRPCGCTVRLVSKVQKRNGLKRELSMELRGLMSWWPQLLSFTIAGDKKGHQEGAS